MGVVVVVDTNRLVAAITSVFGTGGTGECKFVLLWLLLLFLFVVFLL